MGGDRCCPDHDGAKRPSSGTTRQCRLRNRRRRPPRSEGGRRQEPTPGCEQAHQLRADHLIIPVRPLRERTGLLPGCGPGDPLAVRAPYAATLSGEWSMVRSRAHYPSDVFAGAFISVAVAVVGSKMWPPHRVRDEEEPEVHQAPADRFIDVSADRPREQRSGDGAELRQSDELLRRSTGLRHAPPAPPAQP